MKGLHPGRYGPPLCAVPASPDTLIRRHGQVVQACPGVAACCADIPGLSISVGGWLWAWCVSSSDLRARAAPSWHASGVIAQTVLAAFALALAIASLLWQAWTYQHSGSRFTVQAQIGLLLKPGPNR